MLASERRKVLNWKSVKTVASQNILNPSIMHGTGLGKSKRKFTKPVNMLWIQLDFSIDINIKVSPICTFCF